VSPDDRLVEPVETRPPLFVIKGDASAEEVAALTAVLQAMAASAAAAREKQRRPRPEWSHPRRQVRGPHHAGPGGWRAGALPR
jgi:hypothetical protein